MVARRSRDAAAAGAGFVLTPEVTNILSSDRDLQARVLRTEAEDEAETVALLAEPQHMNMAEQELIRALQSDRDGGQEERY